MTAGPVGCGGIARELAGLPGTVERLLVLHVPDPRGRCRGCTTAGTGMPGARGRAACTSTPPPRSRSAAGGGRSSGRGGDLARPRPRAGTRCRRGGGSWHAVAAGALPAVWAVVVGIGPVLLAVGLSHFVALVLDDAGAATATSPATGAPPAVGKHTAALPPAAALLAESTGAAPAAAPAIESSRAGQVTPEALTGPGVHHGLAAVPTYPDGRPQPAQGTDSRVEQVAAQLRRGTDLTGAAVAAQLGCSPRTGRRLLQAAAAARHRLTADIVSSGFDRFDQGAKWPTAGARTPTRPNH